jgi:hypothetical protein
MLEQQAHLHPHLSVQHHLGQPEIVRWNAGGVDQLARQAGTASSSLVARGIAHLSPPCVDAGHRLVACQGGLSFFTLRGNHGVLGFKVFGVIFVQ